MGVLCSGVVALFLFVPVLSNSISKYTDKVCEAQNEKFLKNLETTGFIKEYKFSKETKTSVLLSWSTGNKQSLVLVAVDTKTGGSSNIYKSKNAGVDFTKISDKFDGGKIVVLKLFGLQRNAHKPEHILMISVEKNRHYLWISENDGDDWKKYNIPFVFGSAVSFHPKQPTWGIALSSTRLLYGTKDGGKNWFPIQKRVEKFAWSTHEQDPVGTVYILRRTAMMGSFFALFSIGVSKDLMKMEGFTGSPKIIRKGIWQFSANGKFLYISEIRKNRPIERYMKVSTDGGKSFDEVQLNSITPDRFYSIMDMSEGLIFMHVDNPGNTGHGVLYTSGADGILYSKSLEKHLYPNFPSVSDFYRVLSMRGTYITTQMNDDNSMHTVISFNRGAEWHPLRKPENVNCEVPHASCGLQISSLYSKVEKVKTHIPMSSDSAPGIILVHGHTNSTLQTTPPDVYVTSDGGYTWNRALIGPHIYQIADHGGLLVAVPEKGNTVVKFSTDEGRCWHSYKFTNDSITVTGVLTEPKNKIMEVVIWGYGNNDRIWRVYSINFAKAVKKQCGSQDYETWVPHAEMTHSSGKSQWNGCLLGVKETFKRLKKDSWCSNGQSYEVNKDHKACPCTQDDYECDYGYSRPVNSYQCTRDTKIKELESCVDGTLKKILTHGYRKLPGDQCQKGFHPEGTKLESLRKKCGINDKGYEVELGIHENTLKSNPQFVKHEKKFDKSKLVWIIAGVCFILITAVLIAVMISRYRQLRERHVNYKYSLLNTQNDEAFDTAVDVGMLDHEADKNADVLSNTRMPSKSNNVQGNRNPILRSYHDDDDVDMLE